MMHTRKLKRFGVIERPDGFLILSTIRESREESAFAFLKHNPQVEGVECAAQLVELEIFIHEGIEQPCFSELMTEQRSYIDLD